MEKYNRKAIYTDLKKYDSSTGYDDYIEVVEWANGDGFDVDVCSNLPERFQLSYGTFKALKKLVKKLDK